MMLVKVLLAFFLPPVAAFMQVGLTTHFWINLALTLLAWAPGMVHAFWLVFTDRAL